MGEEKCTSFQQFSFQIYGHTSQVGNQHYSVTVKQPKITSLFIFPISKITISYFLFCSQTLLNLPTPPTNDCIQKTEAIGHSFLLYHQNYLSNPCSLYCQNKYVPLSSKSNPFICALGLISSRYLKDLTSFSVMQRQFLPQWICGIAVYKPPLISPASESTSPYIVYPISLFLERVTYVVALTFSPYFLSSIYSNQVSFSPQLRLQLSRSLEKSI